MAETETAPTSFYFLPKQPSNKAERKEETEPATSSSQHVHDDSDGTFSWLKSWFGGRRGYRSIDSKIRKVPTKVEPKVVLPCTSYGTLQQ